MAREARGRILTQILSLVARVSFPFGNRGTIYVWGPQFWRGKCLIIFYMAKNQLMITCALWDICVMRMWRWGDKFASRSWRCVFVGYPYGKKGWRLYDLEKQDFIVSRDVVFLEDFFPLPTIPFLTMVDCLMSRQLMRTLRIHPHP